MAVFVLSRFVLNAHVHVQGVVASNNFAGRQDASSFTTARFSSVMLSGHAHCLVHRLPLRLQQVWVEQSS